MHPALQATLAAVDPEVAELIASEERRQRDKIRLIASENYVSGAVLAATGSVLTNKYSEGYPGKRYYEGQQYIDKVEQLCIDRAKTLFGADVASEAEEVAAALTESMVYLTMIMLPFVDVVTKLPLNRTRRAQQAHQRLDATIYRIIEQRRASQTDRPDLLTMLLQARDEEGDGTGMTDQRLIELRGGAFLQCPTCGKMLYPA